MKKRYTDALKENEQPVSKAVQENPDKSGPAYKGRLYEREIK